MHKVLDASKEFFAVPLAKPPAKEDEWKGDVFLSPFWWVSTTEDEQKVNMVIVDKGQNAKVPCLVNNRVIQPHQKLYRYKAKAVVVSRASAESVESEEKNAKRLRKGVPTSAPSALGKDEEDGGATPVATDLSC